jgi:hypothetical protein
MLSITWPTNSTETADRPTRLVIKSFNTIFMSIYF